MATAKKRTKKTAAAPTAAKPAKAGTRKKTSTRAPAGTSKKADSAAPAATSDSAAPRGGGARKAATRKTAAAKAPAAKAAKAPAAKAAKAPAAKVAKAPAAKAAKAPAAKTAPRKTSGAKTAPRKAAGKARPAAMVDAEIFLPMTEGERAEALRVLLEDSRLASMASVGRYRVIALEPLAVKPPHGLAGRRLSRVVIYDYASDRSVDACIDLDHSRVAYLNLSRAQPMLAREEEAAAISIALSDERVKEQLSLGEEPQVAMHYWSNSNTSLSFARRSAAVIFGRPDSSPSLIAVVDLLDNLVSEIVPATQW